MNWKTRASLIGTVAGIAAGLVTASIIVGRVARLVDVVGLYALGFGAGASLVSWVVRYRESRRLAATRRPPENAGRGA